MSRPRPLSVVAPAMAALAVAIAFLGCAAPQVALPSAALPSPASTDWPAACAAAPATALHHVEQTSMEPGLEPDDIVLLVQLTAWATRGAIVVFAPPPAWPQGDGTAFIKRVVALAGDKVELRAGRLWVNGVAVDEPYLYPGGRTEVTGSVSSWQLADGQLFVLGDQRPNSADSRVFGPIARASVTGVAVYRCSPNPRAGPIR